MPSLAEHLSPAEVEGGASSNPLEDLPFSNGAWWVKKKWHLENPNCSWMPFPPRSWVNCSDMMGHVRKHKDRVSEQKRLSWEAESLSIGTLQPHSPFSSIGSWLGSGKAATEKQRQKQALTCLIYQKFPSLDPVKWGLICIFLAL